MSATFLKIKKTFYSRGFSLVEMILYAVFLTFVMGLIVQTLISVGGVYRNVKLTRELESSGAVAMESMLREIRNASTVDLGGSNLGTSPGTLALAGLDESANSYTTVFDVSAGVLRIAKNGEAPTPIITSSQSSVSYLTFSRLATSTSQAIRVELEVSGSVGDISKSEKFYGFAVLRGSY